VALYQKVNGVWTLCQRPYVQRGEVWTAVMEAHVKRSGAWVQAYEYDVTPPSPPIIGLSINEDFDTINGVKTLKSRWIRVSVRLPGTGNDPDARLTRVLTDYAGAAPTTQFGGTYTSASDSSYPNEPWSEWRYNDYGGHNDTSVEITKQWPRNASAGTIIKGDQTYHFKGWALDNSGNWSAATGAQISVPKNSVNVPNVVTKEARIQPNTTGSWITAGYQSGNLVQAKSPRSVGLWLFGNQITDAIGQQGEVTIKSAQIFIKRLDDTGVANANVYIFWTGIATVGGLPAPGGSLGKTNITKLGTIAKGQGKWFDLPTSFNGDLNKNVKGMGLDWKDPVKADAFPEDYSEMASLGTSLQSGELHLVWEEAL
jgi:hypothetical protein